ncbi:MAG: hypothetical protein UX09_C0041G0005 [Candidatus Uhrbacteria bacterium GW2011_GWE2_45_35]|uniref:Uncharacterized protein n=1 Tax=Candidatus Uhrbacteria bacterium GW2011_GWE2_45_35 TaxID=1618993 RepID=A0A0G1MFD7_9BACT|nr:MAG: hypothetical protein UX09_C0041G0005 [Candidatus Uhrbacteria bacterium GW2011_GWE2_45_35]
MAGTAGRRLRQAMAGTAGPLRRRGVTRQFESPLLWRGPWRGGLKKRSPLARLSGETIAAHPVGRQSTLWVVARGR